MAGVWAVRSAQIVVRMTADNPYVEASITPVSPTVHHAPFNTSDRPIAAIADATSDSHSLATLLAKSTSNAVRHRWRFSDAFASPSG